MTLALSFSACGKKKGKTAENKVDLEYYAELGQIPECPYKLGADPDEIKEKLQRIHRQRRRARNTPLP